MARINLLPWREELRRKRQKEFGVMAGVAVVAMCAVVYGVYWNYQEKIAFQKARNAYLEQQITALDNKIKDIKDLDIQKRRLIARMEIIQQLQASRPEIVHLFDELVRTMPEGVYIEQIEQKGNVLALRGVAQSNAFVSSLMRNLNQSEWMDGAVLKEIVAKGQQGGSDLLRLAQFSLEVKQVSKNRPNEDES